MKSKKRSTSIGLVVALLLGVGTLAIYAEDVKEKSNMRSQKAEAMLKKAKELRKRHKYKEAIIGYQEIVDSYPEDNIADEAEIAIGDIHVYRQNYKNALIEYKKILNKYPTNRKDKYFQIHKARKRIFFTLLEMKKYDEAKQFLSKNMKNYNYPQKFIEQETEQAEEIIRKWKSDEPEKEKIRELILQYEKAIETKDIVFLKSCFTPDGLETKFPKLKQYITQNPDEGERRIKNLRILVHTKKYAEAKGDIIIKTPPPENIEKQRLIFFKLKKINNQWKISN